MNKFKTKIFFGLLFLIQLTTVGQKDTCRCELGIASYYARAFEGRRCSNGEIFRHDSLTAAHKTMKFGTRVRVTNLKNDSVIVVRINDRLPKTSKRSIDLTKRGARQLNFVAQGLTRVRLEVISDSLKSIKNDTVRVSEIPPQEIKTPE